MEMQIQFMKNNKNFKYEKHKIAKENKTVIKT